MAEVQQSGGGQDKKGKMKKQNLRVDFTPMVDMNMLLITFFMFCTTLSKPQVMDIAMPADSKDIPEEMRTQTKESLTLTVLLGANDTIYYYAGKANYSDHTSLVATNYSPEGLRAVLLERNAPIVAKMRELRLEKAKNSLMTDQQFQEQAKKIKDVKDGQVIIIKPTKDSSFKNLVDVLDEMQICSIDTYAIVDIDTGDEFLIENLRTKGAHAQSHELPQKQ